MKRTIKAALVSGLLFPGLGQILVLKRLARGCIFLVPTLAGALYVLRVAFAQINALADQLASGAMPFDVALIAQHIAASRTDGPAMTAATLACVLCWSASILDALIFGNDPHHGPHPRTPATPHGRT